MRTDIQNFLQQQKEKYLADMNNRLRFRPMDAARLQVKQALFDVISDFKGDENEATLLQHVMEKIALIDKLLKSADIRATLIEYKSELDAELGAASKGGIKTNLFRRLIDQLLALFGQNPRVHFEDVLKESKEYLLGVQRLLLNTYKLSSEQITQLTNSGNPLLDVTSYLTSNATSDQIKQNLKTLFSGSDPDTQLTELRENLRTIAKDDVLAKAIERINPTELSLFLQTAVMASISFKFKEIDFSPYFPVSGNNGWQQDDEGIYYNAHLVVQSVNGGDSGNLSYKPNSTTFVRVKDNNLADRPPFAEIMAKIRLVKDSDGKPKLLAAEMKIINHAPEIFSYTEEALSNINTNLAASAGKMPASPLLGGVGLVDGAADEEDEADAAVPRARK